MGKNAKCYHCMDTGMVHTRKCAANLAWDVAGACNCVKTWCRACRRAAKRKGVSTNGR